MPGSRRRSGLGGSAVDRLLDLANLSGQALDIPGRALGAQGTSNLAIAASRSPAQPGQSNTTRLGPQAALPAEFKDCRDLEAVVATAGAKGYAVTMEEAQRFGVQQTSRELSDEELEGVAGGKSVTDTLEDAFKDTAQGVTGAQTLR